MIKLRRRSEAEQNGHVGLVTVTLRPDDSFVHGRILVTWPALKSHAVVDTHNFLMNQSKADSLMLKGCSLRTIGAFFVTPCVYGFPHRASRRCARPQLNL